MAKKARKTKAARPRLLHERPPQRSPRPSPEQTLGRIERFFDSIAPDLVGRLTTAEMERKEARAELSFLKMKLAGLLNPAQTEAARICGCTPEVYALEFIELRKQQFFPEHEGTSELVSLASLTRGRRP